MFEKLLSRGGLSLDRLRTIVELDEAGTLAKASRGNPNRQSQFSRQLRELEDFFELELVCRDGKTLILTESGKRLAEIVRESFLSLEHFESAYKDTTIQVKIGAGDSLLQWFLCPRLPILSKELPTGQFVFRNLRTRDVSDCLIDLTLDLGLLRSTGISPKLNSARVHSLAYSVFAPRNLVPPTRKTDLTWIAQNVPFAVQEGDSLFQNKTMRELEKKGIKFNVKVRCESFPEICRVVQTGLCAAILPSIAERDLPKSDFLKLDPQVLKDEERIICLAWNPRIQRVRPGFDRIIALFKDILMD